MDLEFVMWLHLSTPEGCRIWPPKLCVCFLTTWSHY